jgi:hypothetical protein
MANNEHIVILYRVMNLNIKQTPNNTHKNQIGESKKLSCVTHENQSYFNGLLSRVDNIKQGPSQKNRKGIIRRFILCFMNVFNGIMLLWLYK